MDDELQDSQKKISIVIGILGIIVALVLDGLSLIPGAGDIEAAPAGVIILLNMIFGMGTVVLIVQGVVEFLKLIPVVQEFPLWTPAWLFTWYVENHPSRLTSKLETVAALSGGDLEERAIGEEAAEGLSEGAAAATETTEAATAAGEAGAIAEEGGAIEAGTAAEGEAAEGEAPEGAEKESEKNTDERRRKESQRSSDQGSGSTEDESEDEDEEDEEDDDMLPDSEKDPIVIEEREQLGDEVPITRAQVAESEPEAPRENESTMRLRERFEAKQRAQAAQEVVESEKPKDENVSNNYLDEAA